MCKKLVHPLTYFLLSFFACLFTSSCFLSPNVSAVSDISVTVTSRPSAWSNIFPDCTGTCLDSYNYLIVEPSSSSYIWTLTSPYIRYNGSSLDNLQLMNTYAIYKLPFNGSSNNLLQWSNTFEFELPVTLTLTENYVSCPACPEPEPTPEPEPCPENPYDDKLDSIIRAIYVVAAVLLVIYFFYAIYRFMIRGSGGLS